MFSWRARRQIAAMAAVLAVAGAFALLLAGRVLPEASCTDGRKNQGEQETDCGGPCRACELKSPKPLSLFWARAGRVSQDGADGAALVENPNTTLSSDRIRYTFILLDAYGIIGEKTGTAYIYPGERLTIVEPGIRTAREAERVEFEIDGVGWAVLPYDRPRLVVERRDHRVRGEGQEKYSVIEAEIHNADTRHFRRTDVTFAVFDETDNLVGANRVLVENLLPGERRTVLSVWQHELPGSITRIEVTPRVNFFETDAVVAP